jgi:hypothetical protein
MIRQRERSCRNVANIEELACNGRGRRKLTSMSASNSSHSVNQSFYQPLVGLAANSKATRTCPEYSDEDYLRCGIQRVLEESPSGRAFLQEHVRALNIDVTKSNYFANLQSERRLELLQQVDAAVHQQAQSKLVDRLEEIAELANYECFAADGHWHKAATHDRRHEGTKMAVGHFYALDLRTHSLRHLATGEGWHEHDMSALKRVKPKGLRQQVPKGRRVLMVYDKAGIDFDFWKRCRHECAVYFLKPGEGEDGSALGTQHGLGPEGSAQRGRHHR